MREPSSGKGRFDLITPFGLDRLARWYELGSKKYADRNWEKGMLFSRYIDSAERHINSFKKGLADEDHLAAAVWNLMAILHHQELGQTMFDDMPGYLQQASPYAPAFSKRIEPEKKKLTVLVDFDDVLFPLLPRWLNKLNELYGVSVSTEDVTSWDIAALFPDLRKEQVFSPLHTDGFWKNVEPVEDSVYDLSRIAADGHSVYVATDTHYGNFKEKVELLLKHFTFLSWRNVIRISHKQLIEADVLIDDAVHQLKGGGYAKILFDRPHNRSFDAEGNGMVRVHTWQEVYSYIDRLAQMPKKYTGGLN